MTKKLIFPITFLLITNIVLGQPDEVEKLFGPTETDSLYILAIRNYTEELDGLNSKVIYVQYENYLSRIPKTVNGFQIIRLGLVNRKEHFRKNKNQLTLVQISSLNLKDGLFSISLIPYSAKLKSKRKLELSYSHFHKTYFRYVNGKLIIDKIESEGI